MELWVSVELFLAERPECRHEELENLAKLGVPGANLHSQKRSRTFIIRKL